MTFRALIARSVRKLSYIGIALAGYTVSACAPDQVLAPAPASVEARQGLITSTLSTVTKTVGSLVTVDALTWKSTVTAASAGAVIGRNGGTIQLGDARLTVPAGAVSSNTAFMITRVAGNIVAYEFEPHGTTFAKPLTFDVKTSGTTLASYVNPKLHGAYFPLASLLDQVLGIAQVSEFRDATLSADKGTITFTIPHFSGYMVSMD
jgi:hypothetical protein